MVGVGDVGKQLRAPAHEVVAPAHEVARGAHRLRVDVRLRQHAAAQKARDLVRVDAVVLRLAAVDRAHIESVPQHEDDALAGAKVGKPVPGEHAFGGHREVLAVGAGELQKRLRGGSDVLRGEDVSVPVEHAYVHRAGVKIDAAIVLVTAGIESHSRPPLSERVVVSANTFLDGSVELPSPPKPGASISINELHLTSAAQAMDARR